MTTQSRSQTYQQRTRSRSFETLESRLALDAAPIGDLAEGNANQWGTFASDGATASIVNSATHVKTGSTALRFTTASGFDTGIAYPKLPTASWDLTTVNYLTFWARAENNTPIGFQGNQPVIELKTPTGKFMYAPSAQLLANNAWVKIRVPLAGGDQWTRSATGTPSLANVSQLLIHDDTWDSGFAITFDRIQFELLDPNGLPPEGPTPPSGVNPDAVHPKVLLYVFDPIMENLAGQRLHAAYGWQDPATLTNQALADLRTSSHGALDYQVAETVIADVHPYFTDGFQNTDASFVTNWSNRDFHEGYQFDYVRFANENNIAARIDAGEIDEVWIYAPPIAGLWESTMGGAGAYWINGPTQPIPSQRAFAIMGLNYERGVGEAIHSFGHRAESVMAHVYGSWQANQNHNWNRFTSLNKDQPGLGGVGNVHYPVNGASDYDYFNQQYVLSNADAWENYPNVSGTPRLINAREWSPNGHDPQREYLNWWYGHLPHVSGRGDDFYLNNWWRYIADLDQFKGGNANLQLTEGQPRVTLSTPSEAPAGGEVAIRANVDVDGAIGRVDFYVDGRYVASDDVAPYTFAWNTIGVIGRHVIQAKAYELQNGTEGASNEATVLVTGTVAQHAAAGDFSLDGLINGIDFLTWQRRFGSTDAAADGDGSGVVGATDLTIWKTRFGQNAPSLVAATNSLSESATVASLEAAKADAQRASVAAVLDALYAAGDFTILFSGDDGASLFGEARPRRRGWK